MDAARRRLMRALPAAAAAMAAVLAVAKPARAATSVAELVLACDLTPGPAMRAVGNAYGNTAGVRVNVFPTEPGLILPQLERSVQNDIVVVRVATLDAAVQAGAVAAGAARGAWSNRLVVAVKRGAPAAQGKPIAVCDPSPASDIDGPAILARLGLLPTAVQGVIDTDTVVALLLDGTARAGLLHMTDVRAHPALDVIRVVPDDIQPPIAYAAAVTNLARRPNPADLVDFLVTGRATALLVAHGLEKSS
ncbi:MAG TPA: substrate-binding domain-containing protein [Acetobacteraceae bacterium]|nr:substrate-binding domain-containing protein [Acetobacteraceae bacterium]